MSSEAQPYLENTLTMDSGRKSRTRDRLRSFFKRKGQAQQAPSDATSLQPSDFSVRPPSPGDANSGDTRRTRSKYLDAAKVLEETVKACEGRWGSFDFPELKGEPEDFDDSQFREKINIVMDARKTDINDETAWAKCKHAVQCAFTAFSPFAKHFLTIAKDVQAVCTFLAFLTDRSQYYTSIGYSVVVSFY